MKNEQKIIVEHGFARLNSTLPSLPYLAGVAAEKEILVQRAGAATVTQDVTLKPTLDLETATLTQVHQLGTSEMVAAYRALLKRWDEAVDAKDWARAKRIHEQILSIRSLFCELYCIAVQQGRLS